MNVERRSVGTVDVCTPVDALAEEISAELNDVLRDCLSESHPRLVVDMSEVGYMDSVALTSLVDTAAELSERGLHVKLAGVTPTCREILELTGVSGRFQFFEDVDVAVRSFL